jgi:hypothetical protein
MDFSTLWTDEMRERERQRDRRARNLAQRKRLALEITMLRQAIVAKQIAIALPAIAPSAPRFRPSAPSVSAEPLSPAELERARPIKTLPLAPTKDSLITTIGHYSLEGERNRQIERNNRAIKALRLLIWIADHNRNELARAHTWANLPASSKLAWIRRLSSLT